MRQFPAHHVPRPRLADLVGTATVVVAEAGAGYGKTTLAAELAASWHAVPIEVMLHESVPASLLATQLRSAIGRAGFSTAATAMSEAGEDPVAVTDAALSALGGERCALIIDDAQHADRTAAGLIDRLAQRVSAPQHVVVLARRLPPGCERLRRGEFVNLDTDDLRLRPIEVLDLCRRGFGLTVEAADAELLCATTAGWTAATVLAIARACRTGESLTAVARSAGATGTRSAVAAILDEAVGALSATELTALSQIARLPPLTKASIDFLGQGPGFLDRAASGGVPLAPVGDDRWDLPGPVRDLLMSVGPVDADLLGRLSQRLAAAGDLAAALPVALAGGEVSRVAALLADAGPAAIDTLDLTEYESAVGRLDQASLRRHPAVLLHLVRLYDSAGLFDKRTETLTRFEALMEEVDSSAATSLRAAAEVERVTDLLRSSQYTEVEVRASRFLAGDDGGDPVTSARALSALARAVCWRTDDRGCRDESAMRRSDSYFSQAATLYRSVGLHTAAAAMAPYRAMWISYALGDARTALERIDDGLEEVAGRPRKWAYLMSFRGEVLTELSRYDEADTATGQVLDVGDRLGDESLRGFALWNQAIIASHLGDAERVVERVRLVEQHAGEWFAPMAGDFYGDAADMLDRVGESAMAWDYLRRAQSDPKDGEAMIAMSEAALLARHGDPELALQRLRDVFTHRVDPRERWRVTLFQAYAAFRLGEVSAAGLAARAFETAARAGLDQLPLSKEREVTLDLLGLAVETGQPAALALQHRSLPTAVNVLGRFALTNGGRPVDLSAGQSTQLLKLLAVCGGRMPAERIIDMLWPEADLEPGRNRLRTVLNRLRSEAGDVIVRDGDILCLAEGVRVDIDQFRLEARRALALGSVEPAAAVAVARGAIARYRGELLPDDPYEPWAERPRETARSTALELLDMCADIATSRGDLDEVRRLVEVTIELAPYDDDRYLRAATSLLEQGKRAAALAVVTRARQALAELGLPPPIELARIERAVVA
jgi:DNA-binding SARP family transcriptional activator/ATP/maltotriose-dependent transcriptional regulator MalT